MRFHPRQIFTATKGLAGRLVRLVLGRRARGEGSNRRSISRAIVFSSLAVLIIGLAVTWSLLRPSALGEAFQSQLAKAFAALDERDFESARRIASELRMADAGFEELGGPVYILGAALAHDAEEHWDPDVQKELYLVASRYFEESRERSFPAGREPQALMYLGKTMYLGGRYAESQPVLLEALKQNPDEQSLLHRYLAEAYFRDTPQALPPALEHVDAYLADRTLPFVQQLEGWLLKARITLATNDFDGARGALIEFRDLASDPPATAPPEQQRLSHRKEKPLDERLAELVNDGVILQTEMLIRQAQQLSGPEATEQDRQQAATLLQQARDILLTVHQEGRQTRESAYLLGTIFEALGDLPAARDQHVSSSSRYFGTPEGLAAEFRAARVLRLLNEHDLSADALFQVLESIKDPARFQNSHVTLEDVRSEARAFLSQALEEKRYVHASALSEKLFPVFSAPLAKLRQAEVQAAWGDYLERQAESQPYSQATATLQESQQRYRNAGDLYGELAKMRFLTREYSDDVWNSAENYLRGKDYRRTEQQLLEYLKQEPRRRRPRALTMLGESQLGRGQFPQALETFQACLGGYPKDPDSFRARIRAAQTHNELGQLDAATQLLLENLEDVALAPESIDWQDSLFLLAHTLQRQGIEALSSAANVRALPDENGLPPRSLLLELESATQILDEAILRFRVFINRYGKDPRIPQARYLLAEAYRYHAKIPQWKLPWEKIETRKLDLGRNMRQSLENAYQLYDRLTQELNKKQDTTELTPLELAIQRNCYYARAHTLFDMDRYNEALDAYSTATSRYPQEPASLEAYQQIAACYRKLGDPAKALGAMEAAKMAIVNMPTDVDYQKTTRFSRDVWLNMLK